MKRTLTVFAGCMIFAFGCTKSPIEKDVIEELAVETPGIAGRCAAHDVLEIQLQQNPGLAAKMEAIERITADYIKNPQDYFLSGGQVIIPVVFNVLYKTAAENVSLAQLESQIDVLNADFSATNADYNSTPPIFEAVRSGNINIRFVLDQVIRKSTSKSSWRTDDAMKKSARGGIDPTSPTTKMNFWVCNLSGGILGYAQFPGGNSATDGIVCDDNATGITSGVYGKGRTATHEVGHWLNLRHIWGDATCGNDQVADTPTHNTSNGGCPTYPHYSTCSGTPVEMTMNYMDYTYDACMYMFSAGQATRMNATFLAGGGRNSFAQP